MSRIRAVVFDLGGVLVERLHTPFLKSLAKERYASEARPAILAASKIAWAKMRADSDYGENQFWKEIIEQGRLRETIPELKSGLRARFKLNDDVLEFAYKLREREYLLGLLSNHAKPWYEEIAAKFQIFTVFERECAVISCEIGHVKPSREAFQASVTSLRKKVPSITPGLCVLVDDNPENIRGAGACGLRGVLFRAAKQDISELRLRLTRLGVSV